MGKQDGKVHIVVYHIWKIVESANESGLWFLRLRELVEVQLKVSAFPLLCISPHRILGDVQCAYYSKQHLQTK